MRHGKSGRKLGRTSSHRKAMLRNVAVSLLKHERIETTLEKARELRRFVEPLITLARREGNEVARKRLAFSRIRSRASVQKLFDVLAERYRERPGGYLRILKHRRRPGDQATLTLVELMDAPRKDGDAAPAPGS